MSLIDFDDWFAWFADVQHVHNTHRPPATQLHTSQPFIFLRIYSDCNRVFHLILWLHPPLVYKFCTSAKNIFTHIHMWNDARARLICIKAHSRAVDIQPHPVWQCVARTIINTLPSQAHTIRDLKHIIAREPESLPSSSSSSRSIRAYVCCVLIKCAHASATRALTR